MTAPQRVQSMLTGLHGIDIITPGTSTVDHVQDLDTEGCKISVCLKHSVDKRLLCLDCHSHPKPAFV